VAIGRHSGFFMISFYDKHRKSWVESDQSLTPKPNIHAKKILLCIWWDWKGVLYYELLQPSDTIREDPYQQQLINLSDVLEEKSHLLAKNVVK